VWLLGCVTTTAPPAEAGDVPRARGGIGDRGCRIRHGRALGATAANRTPGRD
jgi:hypothetical protein